MAPDLGEKRGLTVCMLSIFVGDLKVFYIRQRSIGLQYIDGG